MEGGIERTPPLESAELYRGAGGKVKKQLGRNSRAAATPYSRPKPSRAHTASGGEGVKDCGGGGQWWFARLVNPAVRLISGATKILPSLFARPMEDVESGPDAVEIEQDIEAVSDADTSHVRALPDAENDSSFRQVKISPGDKDDINKGTENHQGGEDEFLQIEQMIKGKLFSRDEISRLTEILLLARTAHIPATEEGQVKPVINVDAGDHFVTPKVAMEANDKCQMQSEALWKVSTPILQSNVHDEIVASPIDVAKAYMGCRVAGAGSRSDVAKIDTALVPGNGYLSRTLNHSSTFRKPAVCWPGTTLTDQCITPHNQRSEYGIHSSSRSPYARSLRSIPKSKVSSRSLLGKGYESVGPIRRGKQEYATGSQRKFFNVPASVESSFGGKFDVGRASSPVFKNMEAAETSGTSKLQSLDGKSLVSESGVPTAPSHSSQVARKILEHLDRTFPTPKDKADELKLAFSWRKPESPISSQEVAMASGNENLGSSVFEVAPQKNIANAVVILERTSASKEVTDTAVPSHGARLSSLPRTGNVCDSCQTRSDEGTSITSSAVDTLVKDVSDKPAAPSNKVALPSISVQKSRFAFSSDNGAGFTLPVSASQAAFPEPPTPSIIPDSSGNSPPLPPGDASPIPSYMFGTKRSLPPPVFSFPSTSSSSIKVNSSDLKFAFRSPDKKRMSFRWVGKDAVCANLLIL